MKNAAGECPTSDGFTTVRSFLDHSAEGWRRRGAPAHRRRSSTDSPHVGSLWQFYRGGGRNFHPVKVPEFSGGRNVCGLTYCPSGKAQGNSPEGKPDFGACLKAAQDTSHHLCNYCVLTQRSGPGLNDNQIPLNRSSHCPPFCTFLRHRRYSSSSWCRPGNRHILWTKGWGRTLDEVLIPLGILLSELTGLTSTRGSKRSCLTQRKYSSRSLHLASQMVARGRREGFGRFVWIAFLINHAVSSHFPSREAEALADHHIITRALIALPLL